MAGEYSIHLNSGLTVYAMVFDKDRSKVWNGSAFVALSSVAAANFAAGKIACAEQKTSDGTGTGIYVGDRPAGIGATARYLVEFYNGVPAAGAVNVGIQFDSLVYGGETTQLAAPAVSRLKTETADFLGWGRNTEGAGSEWTDDQVYRLDSIVKSALTMVYYPSSVARDGQVHQWSWMRPVKTLTTSAPYKTGTVTIADGVVTLAGGVFPDWATNGELVVAGGRYQVASRDGDTQLTLSDTSANLDAGASFSLVCPVYDLPSDFAGIEGEITYAPGQGFCYPPIQIVPDVSIRRRRQQYVESGHPAYAAVRPKVFSGSTGQRWQLIVDPTPDRVYRLEVRYKVHATAPDDDNQFLLGGPEIGELILLACLSVAEQRYKEDSPQIHTPEFMRRLQAAVSNDAQSFAPDTLGYCGEGGDYPAPDRFGGNVIHTYNGKAYYD